MDGSPEEPVGAPDMSPAESSAAPPIAPAAVKQRPLRVWTVFAVCLGMLVACVGVQIPVVLAMVAIEVARHGKPRNPADLVQTVMQTPVAFVALLGAAQLATLIVWWLASTFGDVRARSMRAIGGTSLGVGAYLCFLGASWAVLLLGEPLGQLAAHWFGMWEADGLGSMYDHLDWLSGLVLVVCITVFPAFCEELFYRGYLQRRLLARWDPVVVIPLVAVIFAAFHGTPVWALTVLPLGLWFGILAWRTGSLWPGIWCHGFINGSVNLWRMGAKMDAWPGELPEGVGYALVTFCGLCLLASVRILVRYRRAEAPPLVAAEPVVEAL